MLNEYINSFHKPGTYNAHYGPAMYRNDYDMVLEYKGYKCYRRFDYGEGNAHYDIVFNDVCISQRCGYSKKLIDKIDNGECYYTHSGATGKRRES